MATLATLEQLKGVLNAGQPNARFDE